MKSNPLSRQFAQGIIDFDECSITIPFVEIVPNGTHWRNIVRTHAPLTARAIFGAQRVDDCAAIDVGRTPAVGRRGDDEWRDGGPLLIGQIVGSKRTSWHTRLLRIRTAWSPSWRHKSGFLIALLRVNHDYAIRDFNTFQLTFSTKSAKQ